MSQAIIKARENGPLLVSGPVVVQDHLGNTFDAGGKDPIALCRCGQSARKPFCDGSHRNCGFVAGEIAIPAAQ